MARRALPGARRPEPRRAPRGAALRRAGAAALALVLALGSPNAPARAADGALTLGGWLPLDAPARDGWCWSGAWIYPVGDPFDYARPGASSPAFKLLRGIERGPHPHDGADLGDGRAADTVRAAASGLVVKVIEDDGVNGYGRHIVLAHRLPSGAIAFSVYAHLGPGGPTPAAGEAVALGRPIALVGRSGRASTDHLHFEVRRARDPGARWEKATPLDPLAFVAARLPAPAAVRSAPLALWGAGADLVGGASDPGARLTRARWWHMLWRAARHPGERLPVKAVALGRSLVQAGALPRGAAGHPARAVKWSELARDLARLRELGLRLPEPPDDGATLAGRCASELGERFPARHPERLADAPGHGPTVAQALLALAALAEDRSRGPADEP